MLSIFPIFYIILLISICLCSFYIKFRIRNNDVLPILARINQIMHLFSSAAFAHLFSVFSTKVKIILPKHSVIVIHNLLVKSLIINNCLVGLGLTSVRFSMLKGTVNFLCLAQLSEPKSNPRAKMKENVSHRKTLKYMSS